MPLKIQYTSDLHLEFVQNKKFLNSNPLPPQGDVLLLAGDIVPFAVMHKHDDFFSYVSDNFKTTYWIPGNHEYYQSDISKKSGKVFEKIKDNVFLVNNISFQHENVNLICSTLWSEIKPANHWRFENELSDFHAIKHNNSKFTSAVFNQLHFESLAFLKQELSNKSESKNIVVSHHVPTYYNYPEEYKGDFFNEAFAVELFDFIEKMSPDLWIYGHSHRNVKDFTIGKTKLLTNQLGYIKYNEQENYKEAAIVQL